jgi:hypothetical protein
MTLDWQSGLQLLGLLGIGGLAGAVIALASGAARLKQDWETLRDALTPYLSQRKAAGDTEAEFLLEAVGPVDSDMRQSAAAIREVQQRLGRKK